MSTFVPTPSGKTVELAFDMKNKFKFYDISWNIRHFFVQTCQENWEIGSPELKGPLGGRLKLILKSSRNEDIADSTLSFTVRRSDSDSGPETLWVNYRVFISHPNVVMNHRETERLCSLNKGSESEVEFSGMTGIFDETKNLTIKIDSFRVDCKVIIYSEFEDFGLETCDPGIMELSEDMLILLNSGLDFDLEVKMGNSLLHLHKSVLCIRSKWFATLIHKQTMAEGYEIVKVDLSNIISDTHFEGLRKIITFIYTGNLKHILEKPCLEVFDLAHLLEFEEIKTCYAPEILHIFSTVDAQEFEIDCYIEDFNSACENHVRLVTPTFAEVCSARTWNFHFYPRKNEETGFVAMYAETNEEIKSMNVCLQISAVNGEGGSLNMTKMLRRRVDGSKRFGIDEFEYKNWLTSDAIGDILNLNIKIKVSTGKQRSYIKKHFIPALHIAADLTALNKLSLDMKAMFEDGEFYDCDFLAPNGLVMAHRYVLAARCRVLYDMVTSSGEDPVFLKDMTMGSLFVVLSFLYSGFIYDMDDDEAGEVLAAAKNFKIPLLMEHCLDLVAPNSPEEGNDGN